MILWTLAPVFVAVVVPLFVHDRFFSQDNVLRKFSVIGHLRYLLIELGPELQ
jgi:hypothetical protein